jgi:predicted Zn-dependent peptidase
VRHWQKRELPLVEARLLLKGGAALDPPEQAGRAWLTAGMLDEGAGDLGAVEFTDALDRLGASFHAGVSQESTFAALSTLKRTFGPAAKLFADAVLRPRFEPKEWERVRRLHVESLKQEEDRASSLARRVGLQAFFGSGHPYGRAADGTIASVGQLGVDALKECHRRLFLPENAVLFTAGDLGVDEVRTTLEETLGKWRAPEGAAAAAAPEASPAPARKELEVVLVEKPGAVQTVIRLFLPGPVYQSPERVRLDLLGIVLGGSFTSRLNQNLREQHGYSYGASSRFLNGRIAGYGTAGSDVQATVTGPALKEFLGEVRRIREGDVSAEEAGKARQQRRTDVIEGLQSLSGLVGTAAMLEANGVAFASLGEELKAIGQLGERDLNALARDAFPLERGLLVLAGDPKTIRDQIAGAGLPEPRVVKPEGAK